MPTYAFVDEFGTPSLSTDTPGVSSYFIVTAVVVGDDVDRQRVEAEKIRAAFFQTGEMKSSTIGQGDHRRIEILEALSRLDICTYTLAVDKRRLNRDGGFAFRGSFFKYWNRKLYEKVCRNHESVLFIADEYGGKDFMDGFQKYIEREIPQSLFTERAFQFTDSKSEVMVQVADLISGSWARVWEPQKQSARADEIAALLLARSVGVDMWPPRPVGAAMLREEADSNGGLYDALIKQHCYRRAVAFLEDTADALHDSIPSAPRLVLEHLLFQVQFDDDAAFLNTHAIIRELESVSGICMSPHELRTTVIAPLRDAGVIVASGPDGYKIPTREKDLRQFAALAQSIVPPMLHRLAKARNELRAASSGSVDILAPTEFTELRALVEAHELASIRR